MYTSLRSLLNTRTRRPSFMMTIFLPYGGKYGLPTLYGEGIRRQPKVNTGTAFFSSVVATARNGRVWVGIAA